MPLILGLKANSDVYIGSERFIVGRIFDETTFRLSHLDADGRVIERYLITDTEAQQVLPDVKISAGKRGDERLARLVIQAPRSITITRGQVLRGGTSENNARSLA